MNHHPACSFPFRLVLAIAASALATGGLAQSPCYHFGSVPTAAQWQRSPTLLACPHAPTWPEWHLFTPAHRAPAPHTGFNPGNAVELPRLIVTWRCTGFLFAPVVIDRVRTMGYVVDQPELACAATN
jgi:hypothetical protein